MSKESAKLATDTLGNDPDYCKPMKESSKGSERLKLKKLTAISTKALIAKNRSQSDIETLARTIDDRRKHRMKITVTERNMFIELCEEVAEKEGGNESRFSTEGLEGIIKQLREKIARKPNTISLYDKLVKFFGCWDTDTRILELFEEGLEYTNDSGEDEFYFRDFAFYNSTLESKLSFMKIPIVFVTFWLVTFLLGRYVIQFCYPVVSFYSCSKFNELDVTVFSLGTRSLC